MLQLRDTRITLARHADVLPGTLIEEEGVALVHVKQNGYTFVQPATGASGELFAGVSYERFAPAARLPLIREYTVPAGGIVQLPRTPAAGALAVIASGNALDIVAGSERPAEDATNVVISGDVLLVGDLYVGRTVRVQMLYVPSVEEARSIQGDMPFGGRASGLTGTIGRIVDGELATSCFDASRDWTNALEVGLGQNGMFVPATGANRLPGVIVKNSPNAANPYLVLFLKVV